MSTSTSPAPPSATPDSSFPTPERFVTAPSTANASVGGFKNRRRAGSLARPSNLPPQHGSKIGPQRTSKISQKLKILPNPDEQDEESGREVYSQVTRIKDSTARRDAERLGKAERLKLPRVTAYATANSYDLDGLVRFLKSRASTRGTAPKKLDECVYTPFTYNPEPRTLPTTMTQMGTGTRGPSTTLSPAIVTSDVFLFQYGVVVIWGMTIADEKRLLRDIAKFEMEKLSDDDVQVENFNFYVTDSYQPRIYNDFIALRDNSNYMVKLSISHAIAQSVKISLFEDLVDNTIEDTNSIPTDIATSGKVNMSRREIMKHIGELFILRININLQGSVLDSPELMWAEPQLEPVYVAARSYLEINQRLSLLNQRLDVIGDLLQMLKEQMSHSQGEHLEWIVIVLIAAEILVAVINIVIDLIAAD
ncbi:DUF155-domain-containing protein [Ascodesmis nigricans]|uniref:DUF155-domain-containing protein n=1 Tax=Ascodesmis nigricans TaxID=341454 RepID=A0A4S2MWM6_9PEZI|nr:DUF155-domain-containing protein [Ascodesmis nigricans]